ncbi:MAG: hypothetical protein EXS36_18245 [Pedosphaera sp.]|nr:hypothetical protein [Pedosphaera sp.]
MTYDTPPRVMKWPFLIIDLLLVGLAYYVVTHAVLPLNRWEIGAVSALCIVAAVLGVIPFLRDHRAAVQLYEQANLAAATAQLQELGAVATQIRNATNQWHGVSESAARAVQSAGEISARMGSESKAFAEMMTKAREHQNRTTQLELDKLRRGEGELLQVIVHLIDHTYALFQAANRSGQPQLIQQLGQFRAACLDTCRRIGLVPHEARVGDPYDPQIHQTLREIPPADGTKIAQTIACGFTFQGQPLRHIVIACEGDPMPGQPPEAGSGERSP